MIIVIHLLLSPPVTDFLIPRSIFSAVNMDFFLLNVNALFHQIMEKEGCFHPKAVKGADLLYHISHKLHHLHHSHSGWIGLWLFPLFDLIFAMRLFIEQTKAKKPLFTITPNSEDCVFPTSVIRLPI